MFLTHMYAIENSFYFVPQTIFTFSKTLHERAEYFHINSCLYIVDINIVYKYCRSINLTIK